jgi:putative endopeptidase
MKLPKTALPVLAVALPLVLGVAACGGHAHPTAPAPTPAAPSSARSASASASASSSAAASAAPTGRPKLGTFGVDTAGMDRAAKPGANFDAYASGLWTKATAIPSDRSRWGMFDQLREESDANVRAILEEAMRSSAGKGSNARKVGDFYAAYLDTAAIEAKGLAAIKPALDEIAGAKTHDDVARLIGRPDLPTAGPIGCGVSLDQKDPDHYVVIVAQSGLGLPEREYYLKKDAQFVEIRTKYAAHLRKLLELAGDEKAAADAAAILALETKIAERHWPVADRRERDKMYNPRTLAELEKEAPEFPWKAYLVAEGYAGQPTYIVGEASAIPKLAKLFRETPVATWRAYLTYHVLRASADVLPSAFDKEVFDFYDHTLNGQPEPRARWKRAVSAVNGALGEAVGEIYVGRYFQPRAKAAMDRLIENLRKAYASRIEGVDWMSAETKKVALEKLATFRPKIGYPAKWKSYAALEVQPGDAFGNAIRAEVWRHEFDRARLGKPSDRDEWRMTPQTVNAYYSPVFNEIVFPAAILQPPFFDPDADPAVNYGGIGGVIGHEMGHGFDDQGAKSDPKGVLRTWWSQADVDAFKKRTDVLADQYATFEPLPGIKVNGRLTLGENIGDVGGLNVSYRAYQLSLDGKSAPVLDGFTGDQRFFLGWAQVWRTVIRDQALRNQVMTDPHSPAIYRVNGVVRNVDAWYAAFDVKPTDALFLAPERRVRIW